LSEYKSQISERYKYTIDDIDKIVKNDSTMFLFLTEELKLKLSELEKINPNSDIIKNSAK
tara:strand:+ start:1340 stop:1519 length:180 start_codon:yes stop_codon:yes gene_type:complete